MKVTNDRRPVQLRNGLELEWQHEHKDGKHNIRMIEINKQIQDVIKEIIAKEFEADTLQTKVNESFDSHLSAIKNHTNSVGIPCTERKSAL